MLARPGFRTGLEGAKGFWNHDSKNTSKTIRAVANRINALKKEYPPLDTTHPDYLKFVCEPTIDIEDFLHRIIVRSKLSKRIVLVALYYIESLLISLPDRDLSQYNTHRMLLVSIILAHKFLIDHAFENRYWVDLCGGVYSLSLINEMELEFLKALDYDLNIPEFLWKTE